MKHLCLLPVALLFFSSAVWAVPPVAWERTYDLTGHESRALWCEQTSDGGFIITGEVPNLYSGTRGYFLMRIAGDGGTLWSRVYMTGVRVTGGVFVHQLPDGGFWVVVSTVGNEADWSGYIRKWDSNGLFVREYVPTPGAVALAANATADGGLILAGGIGHDFYLEKIAPSGLSSEWMRRYPYGTGYNWLRAVISTQDGGYLAVGSCYTQFYPDERPYALKVDSVGVLEWGRVYTEFPMREFLSVAQRTDGTYLMVIEHDLLVNIDTQGDTLWMRSYSSHAPNGCWLNAVVATPGNGAVIVGGWSTADWDEYGYVASLDASGSTLWELTLPREWTNRFEAVTTLTDEGLLVAGSYYRHDMIGTWASLARICADGADAAGLISLSTQLGEDAYRLVHESGQVSRLAFTDFPLGTTGRVTGQAADAWSALPNGDGNDGDSIIFVASVPLTSGSIDTFWISRPSENRCTNRWRAGCRTDTAHVVNSVLNGLEFSGATYGYPCTDITIHVEAEFDVGRYEIWWLHWDGKFQLADSFTAANDSGPHDYVLQDRIGHTQWLLVVEDIYGCRYTFSDRILILGQNVPATEPTPPAPSSFSFSSFPNPFNPSTTLSFSLPREARARIAVFDILGREVAVLADNVFSAGEHRLMFDGSSLPSGLYFARLQSGNMHATHKLLLLK